MQDDWYIRYAANIVPVMARHKIVRKQSRNRTPRGEAGAIWIWGRHAVIAALANPDRIVRRLLMIDGTAFEGEARAEIVARETLAQFLPEGAVHQGLALLAEPLADPGITALCEAAAGRARAAIVVLDQVEDPRNVGAVLRSAAALGAIGLVVPERHAPRETGVLAKAASGALDLVPIARVTNLARALGAMKQAGLWCVGLDGGAGTALSASVLPDRTALILGAEGRGLRRLTAEHCDLLVAIPMSGGIASLNVSAAAAIALHAHAIGGPGPDAEPRPPG